MLTFHGKPELKSQRIAQVRAHRLADQLVHGTYWEDGKGCAVGCTIHSGNHHDYETELGIPVELAYLEDHLFESLPNEKAFVWPERFLEAIPVGVDLRATHINKRFVLALFTDERRGIIPRITDAKTKEFAEEIAGKLREAIAERSPSEKSYLAYLAYLADLADRADLADLADLADRADLAYRADLADLADLADRADLAYLADLADLAYLADLADRADRAYLAHRADRAHRAYLADRADLAHRAHRAHLAHRADRAEILLEVLAASAASHLAQAPEPVV